MISLYVHISQLSLFYIFRINVRLSDEYLYLSGWHYCHLDDYYHFPLQQHIFFKKGCAKHQLVLAGCCARPQFYFYEIFIAISELTSMCTYLDSVFRTELTCMNYSFKWWGLCNFHILGKSTLSISDVACRVSLLEIEVPCCAPGKTAMSRTVLSLT